MKDYRVVNIGKERLAEIKPLWEKLNEVHLRDSHHFKDHYSGFTFEDRIRKFEALDNGDLFIQIVSHEKKLLGYCISTLAGETGEVDSLYLEDEIRGTGLGRHLVESAIVWMKDKRCERIRVSVAEGHESVLDFYGKLGFMPRLTVLELIED